METEPVLLSQTSDVEQQAFLAVALQLAALAPVEVERYIDALVADGADLGKRVLLLGGPIM